jgi:hypothetical protein
MMRYDGARYLLRWCWAETIRCVGNGFSFQRDLQYYDGSSYTADMAVQNVVGDTFRVQPGYLYITVVALAGAK